MPRHAHTLLLGQVARAGFHDLGATRDRLLGIAEALKLPVGQLLDWFAHAADPDATLTRFEELREREPELVSQFTATHWQRFCALVGASPALGAFFVRRPERLLEILGGAGRGTDAGAGVGASSAPGRLISTGEARSALRQAIDALPEDGVTALRVRYRELLAEVMLWDVTHAEDPRENFTDVAESLTALADAALETALTLARRRLAAGASGVPVNAEHIEHTRLAVIAMGKCGARELNVVSDVDVMFIAEPAPEQRVVDAQDAVRVGTRLAAELIAVISAPAVEPPLWEVDAGLRPEGRQGALVRSLEAMHAYYERWAQTWEFQALIKARAAAGDLEIGEQFVDRTRELVWSSAQREDFVGSVRRMRERVTEHIPEGHVEAEIKLGPGGLRDIEFSAQLLQLVHGQHDESLRVAGTLPALSALADGGYIARHDAERLATHYRTLRTMEHRLQLRALRRTALMPEDEEARRVLARVTRLGATAAELTEVWAHTRREVRQLHLKIFYAPLLGAVAALPERGIALSGTDARARLASIGFRDPDGALRHLEALSSGTSRNARIQRNLLPILLRWIAEGTDPDFGLLAFRRISEANRNTPWYLRLLRDGSAAAERLARVVSTSRYATELLEQIPEAVAWLESDELLQPAPFDSLREEMSALVSRRERADEAAPILGAVVRREMLRLVLGAVTRVLSAQQVAAGLDALYTSFLDALLRAIKADPAHAANHVNLAIIAMGRFGGKELGFASDIDLIAVYDTEAADGESQTSSAAAQQRAEKMVTDLRELVSSSRAMVQLDFDLRPEGRSGPIVRSLGAYRSYYERWSLTWEAQALLRARFIAGDDSLGQRFERLADQIRYPSEFSEQQTREVRRLKARVEAERLPRGSDPHRHLKLGPGGLSDAEWLAQLVQLQHAAQEPELRTTSTLHTLATAARLNLLETARAEALREAWEFAGAVRSAAKLWSMKNPDVLPTDRGDLEGIARLLGFGRGQTTQLEERWLTLSRRARSAFEHEFYGFTGDS